VVGGVQAFAAGAIITMLADTMMPEAYEQGGPMIGLVTALGFTLSFLLSQY
jgi:ZIP family zinc transporter